MPELAPWVNPPDYLAAMRSGASIGLASRQQDQSEREAADRLRQSYVHLALQEELGKQRLQAAAQYHQAAMALRAQQGEALNEYRQQEIANQQQRMQPKPMFHFGAGGEVLRLDPAAGNVDVLRQGETDSEEKDYERQLRAAQSAVDVAKRNVDKFGATTPVTSGGGLFGLIPKTTQQKSVFPKEKADQAKAALDAAQSLLDEKQNLLQKYKASKGKKSTSAGGVTHRYNIETGAFEPVNE